MATAPNVVPLKPEAPENNRQSDKKYGAAVMSHGSFVIPSLLLRAQARLLVSSTELVVLLQLLEHWWGADSQAYPSMSRIAERTTLTRKTIQRTIDSLVAKSLITKVTRRLPNGGKTSNEYRFGGLVKRLGEIEPDFDKVRKIKRAAGKFGGVRANG